jgi:hypothetical protein
MEGRATLPPKRSVGTRASALSSLEGVRHSDPNGPELDGASRCSLDRGSGALHPRKADAHADSVTVGAHARHIRGLTTPRAAASLEAMLCLAVPVCALDTRLAVSTGVGIELISILP